MVKSKIVIFLAFAVLFMMTSGFSSNKGTVSNESAQSIALKDEPLTEYQNKLLDMAFQTATMIPVYPHMRDRSKTQERVVSTLLELDQPQKAFQYTKHIEDWHRGLAYGNLALYCAQHGFTDGAKKFIELADQTLDTAEDWKKDVIKVKMAQTYVFLGETQQAEQLETDVVDFESGKVIGAKAMAADNESFDAQMKALDELIATENFEILQNALQSATQLFKTFYTDHKKRVQVEEKIKTSWDSLPLFIRIELLLDLAKFSLDYSDQAYALQLVNEAQMIFDNAEWPLEHHMAFMAQLIELRFKAGDTQKAKTDVEALRDRFEVEGSQIVNIYRAGVLRALAQAYQTLGDTTNALAIYKRAVEEGVSNPNSRPRAEDLAATLISMASNQVEPDAELWQRIKEVNEGLGEPW